MRWNEFTAALKEAKKLKKQKGLSVPVIATMLFSGAMDSMIDPEVPKNVETYSMMFEEVKKALGSKAKLTKKKKTEFLGLEDINGDVFMAMWRHQMNPLSSFDIVPACQNALKDYGFVPTNRQEYPMMRAVNDKYTVPALLTPYWSRVFQNPSAVRAFQDGLYDLVILGLVTSAVVKPYAEGKKEMLQFTLFTGHEYTDIITSWPGEDGKIPERVLAAIKPMELGFAIIKPKPWNGKPGGTLIRWQKIYSR